MESTPLPPSLVSTPVVKPPGPDLQHSSRTSHLHPPQTGYIVTKHRKSITFKVRVNAGRDSTQITRSPPTSTSNVMPVPTYTSQDLSARGHHGRLTTSSASMRSALAWILSLSSASMRSALACILSFSNEVASVIWGRPLGPRYSEIEVYPYRNLLNYPISSLLSRIRRGWGNSIGESCILG
jgi:hypothetical protein